MLNQFIHVVATDLEINKKFVRNSQCLILLSLFCITTNENYECTVPQLVIYISVKYRFQFLDRLNYTACHVSIRIVHVETIPVYISTPIGCGCNSAVSAV
jgi:hypothetical protein